MLNWLLDWLLKDKTCIHLDKDTAALIVHADGHYILCFPEDAPYNPKQAILASVALGMDKGDTLMKNALDFIVYKASYLELPPPDIE